MKTLQIPPEAGIPKSPALFAGLIAAVVSACVFAPLPVQAAIPQQERDALIALYNSTNGPAWPSFYGWMGPAGSECRWVGITCDAAETGVLQLKLNGLLQGTLPPAIGDLTKLQSLDLPYNQLSGSIPAALGKLAQLTYLDLYANQLSGSIPPELGNLTKLTYLDLSGNPLTGSIPANLGSMAQLQILSIRGAQLTGSIPAEIGNLTQLTELNLYGNQLSGNVPSSLGKLASLTGLNLSNNQLGGSIPSELGNLARLKRLYLSGNQLAGGLPSGLGNLTSLTELDLSGNQLDGTIATELGNLTQLNYLNLTGNQLTGTIPSTLGNLSKLWSLDLSGHQLSGTIPSTLGKMAQLYLLDLSGNQLSGSIPVELAEISTLNRLSLANNQLSGGIPTALGKLVQLGSLDLSGNQLSGSIPDLKGLYELSLQSNQLSGPIPPSLGSLSFLGLLDLSGNQLTGSIPAELGNLKGLYELRLDGNQLSGGIPASLGNLTNLQFLDLGYNQLSGGIPAALGNLASLYYLSLYGNQLSGPIPSGLRNLQALHVYLGYNALSSGDSSLNSLLSRAPGWEKTQTVAPSDASALPPGSASILVSWTPISFQDRAGRYEVWSSTNSGGPYAIARATANKSSGSLELTGLTPGRTYHMVVRTVTDPHAFNQSTIASGFSPQLSIAAGSKSSLELTLSAGGSATAATFESQGSTLAGYAAVGINTGAAPYGTAVFSFKQNGVTVSEVGVPASPPATSARFFVDYRTSAAVPGSTGKVDIYTGFAAVNRGSGTANITVTLRGLDGQIITSGIGRLAKDAHIAKFITQLAEIFAGFAIPAPFPTASRFGTLELASDQPLSVLGLRLTTNQRGETLLTSTPVADLTQPPTSSPIYFPQFVDGGGYTTTVILLNTSEVVETGSLQLYANNGSPLTARLADGSSGVSFTYSIQPRAAYILQTDASPRDVNVGWAELTPGGGTPTPIGAGVFQYSAGGVLVTESGIPSATPTTHARIFVDTSKGHNTGLALGNPGTVPLSIRVALFQSDGSTQAGTSLGPVSLDGKGHTAKFVDQMISGLPADFRGVLDMVSDAPYAALTIRSLINERKDFLLTTFPVADMNRNAPSPILFPQIADGGGFTTEIILLSAGLSCSTTTSLFGDAGTPIAIGK